MMLVYQVMMNYPPPGHPPAYLRECICALPRSSRHHNIV